MSSCADEPSSPQERLSGARNPVTDTSSPGEQNESLAVLVRDSANWLSTIRSLAQSELIMLFTPVATQHNPQQDFDPFEPLGRELARRHPRIRHVPFKNHLGLTQTHEGLLRLGQCVILCLPSYSDLPDQVELAREAFGYVEQDGKEKPVVIVMLSDPPAEEGRSTFQFPTVIQTADYSRRAFEATADLIFGKYNAPPSGDLERKLWPIEPFEAEEHNSSVWALWKEIFGHKYVIRESTLASLLERPGWAKHYVVRSPSTREVIGFAATYTSYVDREGESLIASLAILMVHRDYNNQGIGMSLYNHAMEAFRRIRGVVRIQLGSSFPRLFYGPPYDIALNLRWLANRGWSWNKPDQSGYGRHVYDLVLDFKDWKYTPAQSQVPEFRLCTPNDIDELLAMVDQVSTRQSKMCWYDQYSSLMNTSNARDVVLGVDGAGRIIAAALTYNPASESRVASNLPWAARLGPDVGGVTCICLTVDEDSLLLGLLNTCVDYLRHQGLERMFFDAVTDDINRYRQLGFTDWAMYADMWKDA